MDLLTREDLRSLAEDRRGHHVSIYLPTHRGGAEEDRIRWKNLVAEVESRLAGAGMRPPEARDFMAAARRLQDDSVFWKNQCDGLAYLQAENVARTFRLPVRFGAQAIVGKHFHIKPLLPLVSGDGQFFILALSQNRVRLLQATRHAISEVDLRGVPTSLAEALATHDTDDTLSFHTQPGTSATGPIFHGQGVGIDDEKKNLLHYFQRIDRGLHAIFRNEHAPLVVAAVDYFLPLYRQASTYPHLVAHGIEGNPDHLGQDALHARGWALVRDIFEGAEKRALSRFAQFAGTGQTAVNITTILPAALQGQVETLFVARDRDAWGRYDEATQQVEEWIPARAGDEDLLNLAALGVLRRGQSVYALESSRIPGGTGIAAVLRVPAFAVSR